MAYLAPTWLYKDPISATKLNRTNSLVNDLLRDRPISPVPGNSPEQTRIVQVQVRAINNANRTLDCTDVGLVLDVTADQYTVTLPEIFNETSRDGVSYTYQSLNNRTADGTELQEITPKFVLDETFYVIFDVQTALITFLGDGRMWAKTGTV